MYTHANKYYVSDTNLETIEPYSEKISKNRVTESQSATTKNGDSDVKHSMWEILIMAISSPINITGTLNF